MLLPGVFEDSHLANQCNLDGLYGPLFTFVLLAKIVTWPTLPVPLEGPYSPNWLIEAQYAEQT